MPFLGDEVGRLVALFKCSMYVHIYKACAAVLFNKTTRYEMAVLPSELLFAITTYCDVDTKARCASTSKQWRDNIDWTEDELLSKFVYGAATGNADLVERMLRCERKLDPASDKNVALQCASIVGDLEIVQVLMKDARVTGPGISEAFSAACKHGHVDVVEFLLQDARIDPAANVNEAFQSAVWAGQVEVVRLLVRDSRVDPTVWQNMPIYIASWRDYDDIVQLLLTYPRVTEALRLSGALEVFTSSESGHSKPKKKRRKRRKNNLKVKFTVKLM